jgi:hypothetical protein
VTATGARRGWIAHDKESAGEDITLPAGKSTEITLLHAGALRLTAGEAVGGARDFRVQGGARR